MPANDVLALPKQAFPGFGEVTDLGVNWRIKFADADGIPLNMLSFEQIDFGAIAYKEVLQNAKTILATPLYSAVLERLLGIDATIVDLPIDQAAEGAPQATIAILRALYFWEPRVQPVNISFDSDVISGHLICNLQLNIQNIIYGTNTPYDRNNIFETPTVVSQTLPPPQPPDVIVGPPGPQGPAGPTGPAGATGTRGSYWFTGTIDPISVSGAQAQDMYLNTTSGAIFQFDGGSGTWRRVN